MEQAEFDTSSEQGDDAVIMCGMCLFVQEELKHFEHKLNKHEVFKKEADLATGNLKKDNSGMSSDQHKLQVKVKEYGRKVRT